MTSQNDTTEKTYRTIFLRVPPELYEKVRVATDSNDSTINRWVQRAIRQRLEQPSK